MSKETYEWKEHPDIPGAFIPATDIPKSSLLWTEKEIELFAEHSNSPTFVEGLRRYNEIMSNPPVGFYRKLMIKYKEMMRSFKSYFK